MNVSQKNAPKYHTNSLSMFKMIALLQSNRLKVIYNLGAFLTSALPLFK